MPLTKEQIQLLESLDGWDELDFDHKHKEKEMTHTELSAADVAVIRRALSQWLWNSFSTDPDFSLLIYRKGETLESVELPNDWLHGNCPSDHRVDSAILVFPGSDWDCGGDYKKIAEQDGQSDAVDCLVDEIVERLDEFMCESENTPQ